MMTEFSLRAIGHIRTPFTAASGTPIQPTFAEGADGQVIVDPSLAAALEGIEGFERIWLIYLLDRAGSFNPRVVPYRDTVEHGLFATRSPCRPNAIGLSVVRMLRREGTMLHVTGVDILDETPLLDIKPYVPAFDAHPISRAGWFDSAGSDRTVADGRFHHEE